jgi:hypothetical protein
MGRDRSELGARNTSSCRPKKKSDGNDTDNSEVGRTNLSPDERTLKVSAERPGFDGANGMNGRYQQLNRLQGVVLKPRIITNYRDRRRRSVYPTEIERVKIGQQKAHSCYSGHEQGRYDGPCLLVSDPLIKSGECQKLAKKPGVISVLNAMHYRHDKSKDQLFSVSDERRFGQAPPGDEEAKGQMPVERENNMGKTTREGVSAQSEEYGPRGGEDPIVI